MSAGREPALVVSRSRTSRWEDDPGRWSAVVTTETEIDLVSGPNQMWFVRIDERFLMVSSVRVVAIGALDTAAIGGLIGVGHIVVA